MGLARSPSLLQDAQLSAERLNRECFCITLDRDALCEAVEREVGDPDFCATFGRTRPHLFSSVPVFLSESDVADMLRIVRAIETVTRLPGYRDAALSWAPEVARRDHGPLGVFMGYDFHLAGDGPKLIEVNTKAEGAFLNASRVQAQRACCAEVEVALTRSSDHPRRIIGGIIDTPAFSHSQGQEFACQARHRHGTSTSESCRNRCGAANGEFVPADIGRSSHVQPSSAADMTAGHNALRGSGPGP